MPSIQDAFRDGVKGYAPANMWFTSGNINRKEMTYQLEEFRRQGIEDFFIHPCRDTRGDYLGEYFFRMVKHAAAEAKRLGLNYWIYDEYNWPSGIAGGQVLIDAPWARSSRLFRLTKTTAAGETIRFSLPPKERFNTTPLLFLVDGRETEVIQDGDTVTWTNTTSEEKALEIYVTKWIMVATPAASNADVVSGTEGCLDTLDQEAVGVFIQKTHEAYKKQVGEGFGDYIKGVFTDEVVVNYDQGRAQDEEGLPALPWTRFFPEKFQERNGYDIIPRLKDLMGNADAKLCVDYWETISELFMNAFAQMTSDWCTRNGLIYTGHLDDEERIESSIFRSGDPYEYYKRFDRPGIDSIFTYYRMNDYDFNVTAKLASSAAHFHNKERVLSETFTISGWDIRLRDMKRTFHRLALLGVNFIQFMGARYSFKPNSDSQAMTNNWQNPLFRHYNGLCKYISGIQWLVANSTYDAHTLLFYPLTTVRATLPALPAGNHVEEINLTINGLINSLLNLHVDFEIGYEQVIDQAELKDGKLLFAGSEYDTIILPCTTYLKEHTFNKLQQFSKSGGRLIAVNGKPEKIIGEHIYDAPALTHAVVYECRNFELTGERINNFDNYQRAPSGSFTAHLKEALADISRPAVALDACDGIMSAVRRKDGGYYVLIINDNDQHTCASGELLSDMPTRALNTETGEIKPMHMAGRRFSLQLAPYECTVLEISPVLEVPSQRYHMSNRTEIPMQNFSFRPDGANTALPDMWHVRGSTAEEIIRARRRYNAKQVCDLAAAIPDSDRVLCRTNIQPAMPVKSNRDWFGWHPIDKKAPKPGETAVAIYDFVVDSVPQDLELVADPDIETIWFLNDEQLYPSSVRRVWHYANPVFDISDIAVPGKNRLVSICTVPEFQGRFSLPCAVLKGDFRVFDDWSLTQKSGGNAFDFWNDQGYPFHTGDGIYEAEFTAPTSGHVVLELATKDVVEVFVNGTSAGKCLWEPYHLDLTAYLREGVNHLEIRVTSTLSNLLYNRNPSGINGAKLFMEE